MNYQNNNFSLKDSKSFGLSVTALSVYLYLQKTPLSVEIGIERKGIEVLYFPSFSFYQ